MQKNTSVIEEQESSIMPSIKELLDYSSHANIKKWIETFSPLEDVTGFIMERDSVELLFDKNGEKLPKDGFSSYHAALDTEKITVILKDETEHSVGFIFSTGELYKRE